jgi:hypothetical protein
MNIGSRPVSMKVRTASNAASEPSICSDFAAVGELLQLGLLQTYPAVELRP